MSDSLFRVLIAGALCAGAAASSVAAPPPASAKGAPAAQTAPAASPVAGLLADEMTALEREIAARMVQRSALTGERRTRAELEIDLRILQRTAISAAAAAKPDTNEQAVAFLRAKQVREAARALEEALGQSTAAPTPSQREAAGALHKLSFTAGGAKQVKELDDFCRQAAVAMLNAAAPAPVDPRAIPAMRPKPQAADIARGDDPATVGELAEQVQKLAAVSPTLRQQLLALVDAVQNAKDKAEAKALRDLLDQSVDLARGLQSNTAVTPEQRLGIEGQLTEGVVLFSDPRTRDAGKSRLDALGQYRLVLTRIGKMGLSREQMDQLAPALTWAQANGDAGAKLMATLEQYMDLCARWDALSRSPALVPNLKRPHDEIAQQFARRRASFMQDASKVGGSGVFAVGSAELDQHLDELKRLHALNEDVEAMAPSLDTIVAYRIRPAGALEKKVALAAVAAASAIRSPARTDAEKFLDAVHALAEVARRLSAKPLTDVPSPTAQGWAGGRLDAFEARWKGIVVDLANGLVAGSVELDKGKLGRLETALVMGEALRGAVQLEAALAKTPALARWVDWSVDPAALQLVIDPYKQAMAAAFAGYATDTLESVDRWQKLHGRYTPLIALIGRDVAYADQCQALPTGLTGDAARLHTPFDNAPFAAERFASYAVTLWAVYERAGDAENADRVSLQLARRLARDLRLNVHIGEDAPPRPVRKKM